MRTSRASPPAALLAPPAPAGGGPATPSCAASSRAIPRCESASGRLGVTFTSRMSSATPKCGDQVGPGRVAKATESRFRHLSRPAPARARCTACPGDITPRTSRASSVRPAGQPRARAAPRPPGCPAAARWARRRRPLPRGRRRARAPGAACRRPGCGRIAQHLGHQHAAPARGPAARCPPPPARRRVSDLGGGGGVQRRRPASERQQLLAASSARPSWPRPHPPGTGAGNASRSRRIGADR